MGLITACKTPQDQPAVPLSSCRKLLYMSHLALGDYIYQGPFLKALANNYPDLQLDIWIDDCRREKNHGMLGAIIHSHNGSQVTLI